ncbi:helix-turn-helix domain-containing protein [Ligilactobacillus salivarius]|uniref:helix-turn-helix domain-containing protein n=1 Tax=Ligilactobacillus salivarius TaxID=1624 RepID=UPI003D784A86
MLIGRGMKKKYLKEKSGISSRLIAKLGKNKNMTIDVLLKIGITLKCDISDIMEFRNEE